MQRARGVHVRRRIADRPVPDLGRHEHRLVGHRALRNGRQHVAAEAQVRDRPPAARLHQHGRRHDPPGDDPVQVRVLQAPQQVASERQHGGDDPRPPLDRFLQSLAVDPVADAVGQLAGDAGVVHVADRRMVEPAEGFALALEPGARRLVVKEVDPDAHPALERLVVRLEEQPVGVGGHDALEPVSVPQRRVGTVEGLDRLGTGHRRRPRRRSTLAVRPQTSGSHQRRLPVDESSVK